MVSAWGWEVVSWATGVIGRENIFEEWECKDRCGSSEDKDGTVVDSIKPGHANETVRDHHPVAFMNIWAEQRLQLAFLLLLLSSFSKSMGWNFGSAEQNASHWQETKNMQLTKFFDLKPHFYGGCVRFAWVVNLSPWWYFGKLRVNQLRFRHLPHPGCEGLQSFLFDSRHLIFVSLSLSLRLARYPTLPTVLENGMRIWATRTILSRLTGSKTKNLKSVKV